jgi:hypothetical protein
MKKLIETIGYDSSSVSNSTYNFKTKTLVIHFKSDIGYSYEGVEIEDYLGFSQAESIGKSFHQFIRGKYEIKKFEEI